jgi:hypothetical protein
VDDAGAICARCARQEEELAVQQAQDGDLCNCDQSLRLQERVESLERQLAECKRLLMEESRARTEADFRALKDGLQALTGRKVLQ